MRSWQPFFIKNSYISVAIEPVADHLARPIRAFAEQNSFAAPRVCYISESVQHTRQELAPFRPEKRADELPPKRAATTIHA
jgi:hypothetical protein